MALSHWRRPFDFEEIRVFDDNLDDMELMRKIISLENWEDPFHVLDVGDVVKKHHDWIDRIPRVIPHYGILFYDIIYIITI